MARLDAVRLEMVAVLGMLRTGKNLQEIAEALHVPVTAVGTATQQWSCEQAREMWGRL
ncbi:MAG: hypothetical protein ACOY94_14230 [Bacillota bacterium]